MKKTITTVVLALALTACGGVPVPAYEPTVSYAPTPEPGICASKDRRPVRLPMSACQQRPTQTQWLYASVRGLDPDDYTAIGERVDDDYKYRRPTP